MQLWCLPSDSTDKPRQSLAEVFEALLMSTKTILLLNYHKMCTLPIPLVYK